MSSYGYSQFEFSLTVFYSLWFNIWLCICFTLKFWACNIILLWIQNYMFSPILTINFWVQFKIYSFSFTPTSYPARMSSQSTEIILLPVYLRCHIWNKVRHICPGLFFILKIYFCPFYFTFCICKTFTRFQSKNCMKR